MTRHKRYNSRLKDGVHKAGLVGKPQKRFFRMRAHCNPLTHSVNYNPPNSPDEIKWDEFYTDKTEGDSKRRKVEIADVGCGFGGLTVELARIFPDTRVLGMEIRIKVAEYVRLRIEDLRKENPGQYGNAWVLQTNAMKHLPNYFEKGQLKKIFFCFPDPHFKAKNHRRRIVTPALLAEYAYALKEGGILYTITDVLELHQWMDKHCSEHPCFEKLTEEELKDDPAVNVMTYYTEEGMKVERNKGDKYKAVFRRLPDAEVRKRLAEKSFWDSDDKEQPAAAGSGGGGGGGGGDDASN